RIDVGLFELVQELPRVCRKRFDITALAFGIDRIERERRFARTRKPGNDRKFIARNFYVNVLWIMLARSANRDRFYTHFVLQTELLITAETSILPNLDGDTKRRTSAELFIDESEDRCRYANDDECGDRTPNGVRFRKFPDGENAQNRAGDQRDGDYQK